MPSQLGEALRAGTGDEGIEAGMDQRGLFRQAGEVPGAGDLLIVQIQCGAHLHQIYITMQTNRSSGTAQLGSFWSGKIGPALRIV